MTRRTISTLFGLRCRTDEVSHHSIEHYRGRSGRSKEDCCRLQHRLAVRSTAGKYCARRKSRPALEAAAAPIPMMYGVCSRDKLTRRKSRQFFRAGQRLDRLADEPVNREPVSGVKSLQKGKIQGFALKNALSADFKVRLARKIKALDANSLLKQTGHFRHVTGPRFG